MVVYTWDFSVIFTYKEAILKGTLITLELTFFSIILGSILGMRLCLMKLSKNPILKYPAIAFIEVFQDLPLLILLIWLFYALPPLFGIHISAFLTALIGLSLNLGAFSAEIFRAGIISIPKGQRESSIALGLSKYQTMKDIILPQAKRVIIPPLTGRYIETIKLTSLASVIAVDELLHSGQNLISVSYRPLEVYTIIALLYLAIIVPLTLMLKKLEKSK
ncbi:amino acid ABC transporter permease [Candidatus Pacearchaeota archaeon]|nr:amino acid ABC transporter permease [Candidatus Pacearchaeota archaeon]